MTPANASSTSELHTDVLSLDMPPVRRRLQQLAGRLTHAFRGGRRRTGQPG